MNINNVLDTVKNNFIKDSEKYLIENYNIDSLTIPVPVNAVLKIDGSFNINNLHNGIRKILSFNIYDNKTEKYTINVELENDNIKNIQLFNNENNEIYSKKY